MAKSINLTKCGIATITNIYNENYVDKKEEALSSLDPFKEDQVFNTGASYVGDPHIDAAYVADNKGKGLIKDTNPFDRKHVASIRLFGGSGNSFVYLNPGDEIKLTVTPEQALFYLDQAGGFLEVKIAPTDDENASCITEVADPVAAEEFDEPYLDRTTGIGDDGDPINFDSEKATEEMTGEAAPAPDAPEAGPDAEA